MKLVVYYASMSSATRVLWALEELGIHYEKVKLDLASGDQRKPEYLALNPNGKVPLLVADGTPIFESLAIISFLGETFGVEKGFFPASGLSRSQAFQWMFWSGVTMGDSFGRFLRNTHERYPAEQRNEAAAEAAKKELANQLTILEHALKKSPYLLGNGFTFVDIPAFGYCAFGVRMGAIQIADYPNVKLWVDRCANRAALQRAQVM